MRYSTLFIAACLCGIPSLTLAQNVNLTFENTDLGNDYTLNYNGNSEGVFVGSLLFKVNSSQTLIPTYCVDLDNFITSGQTYGATVIQTDTLPTSNAYRLAGDILNAGVSTATDANHSAALQIAIWDAVYGNKFSLSGVSSTVEGYATSYYNAGLATNANAIYLQDTVSNNGQSQITTTPEPAAYAILGCGFVGLLFRRKRVLA